MLQTLLERMPQERWAGVRRFFDPGAGADKPGGKSAEAVDPDKAERLERDEAFYWGFSPYGPW